MGGGSRTFLCLASCQAENCFPARPLQSEHRLTLTSVPASCPLFDHPNLSSA
jgi:hypothetical protein